MGPQVKLGLEAHELLLESFSSKFFQEPRYLLRLPGGCARAEFDGFGEAASFTAFPPCAFADGDELQDLRETEKADGRDCGYDNHRYTSNMAFDHCRKRVIFRGFRWVPDQKKGLRHLPNPFFWSE